MLFKLRLQPHIIRWYRNRDHVEHEGHYLPDERQNVVYKKKKRHALKNYFAWSIGEFLIFPMLICSLYAFVNEKSWRLNSAEAVFSFLIFIYSIGMDIIYWRAYFFWLIQKVIKKSYHKYDELLGEYREVRTRSIYFTTPCTFLFAAATTLLHWLMIVILGLRIYSDNFSSDDNNTTGMHDCSRFTDDISSSGNMTTVDYSGYDCLTFTANYSDKMTTGRYHCSSFTGYMIGCFFYLPVISWVTYIALNKYWFYEVYSVIKQHDKDLIQIEHAAYRVKLLVSTLDYSSLATVFLIIPFIAFTVGSFQPTSSAGIGVIFTLLFLITNCQAVIVFCNVTFVGIMV